MRWRRSPALPDYMIPAGIVVIDEMPLLPNGKLDRSSLPIPEFAAQASRRAPESKVEKDLCQLFAEVLAVPAVGADDNFYDLGGHSLLAVRLINSIRQQFNVDVRLKEFFKDPSPSGAAELVANNRDMTGD